MRKTAHYLRKVERSWRQINSAKQCQLNAMRHDKGALALCLRRPIHAADDLIEAMKEAD